MKYPQFYSRYYHIDDCTTEFLLYPDGKIYYYSTCFDKWFRDYDTSIKELKYHGSLMFSVK